MYLLSHHYYTFSKIENYQKRKYLINSTYYDFGTIIIIYPYLDIFYLSPSQTPYIILLYFIHAHII